MNKRRRAVPLRISLLYSLRDQGAQTSMELTLRLNPYPDKSLVQARNGVNARLNDLERAGHAKVAGQVPAEYHNTPAFSWKITPAGALYLADWEKHQAAKAQRDKDTAERMQAREDMLHELYRTAKDSGWGPDTPTEKRRAISRELRIQGMPYNWIAAIFGVSRELIRQDCTGLVRRRGAIVRIADPVVPKRGPGFVWARTGEGAA